MANMAQIAHAWAHATQDSKPRTAGNVSFYANAYRSYYTTVAAWHDVPDLGRVFLVTSQTFSNSTAKHVSRAWQAAHGANQFRVPYVVIGRNGRAASVDTVQQMHAGNMADMAAHVRTRMDDALRSRKYASQCADDAVSSARALVRYANAFACTDWIGAACDAAGVSSDLVRALASNGRDALPVAIRNAIVASDARLAASDAERSARYATQRAQMDARANATRAERIGKFRAGDTRVTYLSDVPPMLRLAATLAHVETSRGVTVPLGDARALWHALRANVDVIGRRCGFYTVTHVDADTVTIGCHEIPRAECDAFAIVRGWLAPDDASDDARAIAATMAVPAA